MLKIIILSLILLKGGLIANEKKFLESERGFAYGNEEVNELLPKEKQKITDELFMIRKILEKQLTVQEKILTILKDEYAPEPKKIKNEKGEECIANSSSDCFEMPIIPEARRVPVIKEWMEKGDLKSSVNFLQWQSKYFQEISKRAYNNVAAINQYGEEVKAVKLTKNSIITMPISFFLKGKEKICDRVIISLASLIRKCAVQEKFETHLRKLEENQAKSSKFEHIESKKELLQEAIMKVQNNSKELFEIHKVIANALQDIRVDVVHKNNDKAILRIDEILRFYDEKLEIKERI